MISLSARNVTKRYGGVIALSDGSLEVRSGEVLALMGANGSGKSTLSKIITGVVAPNGGQLLLDNQAVHFSSPQAAKKRGIIAVYQDLSLIPDMTVAENIWLTHEPLNPLRRTVKRQTMHDRTQALIDLFAGTHQFLSPDAKVSALPPDEKQVVEILKALSHQPRLMILDEATASLDTQQVNRLFELIQTWKQQGMAIVFVSHRMEEIFRIADRATVLRNGQTVGDAVIGDIDAAQLVSMMIDTEIVQRRTPAATDAHALQPVRLQVSQLKTAVLQGIDLELRDGELLGIGGLQGQGQSDLLMALFGAVPFSGSVKIGGEAVHFRHPQDAMKKDVALVPGERAAEGLLLIRSILENFQLASWRKYGFPLKMPAARADAQQSADSMGLVMAGLDAPVNTLSGGNAQKVVIGKWLLRSPKLLLLNDPTKGIDVGAKAEFYALLDDLQKAGTAIIFYSSDDDELLGLCDRVLVLHEGHIRAELHGDSLNKTQLVAASMGSPQATPQDAPL